MICLGFPAEGNTFLTCFPFPNTAVFQCWAKSFLLLVGVSVASGIDILHKEAQRSALGLIMCVFICTASWIGTDSLDSFVSPHMRASSYNLYPFPQSPETTPLVCRETECWSQHSEMKYKHKRMQDKWICAHFSHFKVSSDEWGNITLFQRSRPTSVQMYLCISLPSLFPPLYLWVKATKIGPKAPSVLCKMHGDVL